MCENRHTSRINTSEIISYSLNLVMDTCTLVKYFFICFLTELVELVLSQEDSAYLFCLIRPRSGRKEALQQILFQRLRANQTFDFYNYWHQFSFEAGGDVVLYSVPSCISYTKSSQNIQGQFHTNGLQLVISMEINRHSLIYRARLNPRL